ncbi:unnamed protein product [marine sediment metagenome]|uniref:Uncharacterized protein n=1 Tax=marine sediment metagenome TaxID=412755 RepID=X0XDI0_9ZZZZ
MVNMDLINIIRESMKIPEIIKESFIYMHNSKEYELKATKDKNKGKIILEIPLHDNTS